MTKISFVKKLAISGGFAGVLLLAAIVACIAGIKTVDSQVTRLSGNVGRKTLLCGQLQGYAGKMRGAIRGGILYSTSNMHKPQLAVRSGNEFRAYAQAVKNISQQLEKFELTTAERDATTNVRNAVENWEPVAQDILAGCSRGDFGDALTAKTMRSVVLADQLDAATAVLVQAQMQAFDEVAVQSAAATREVWYVVVPLVCLAIAAGLGALFTLLASVRVLRLAVGELTQGAEEVASAAAQVSTSSQALAQGASEQAACLEETSAATEEIKSMAQRNTESGNGAAAEMGKTGQVVADANAQLDQMLASMEEISNSSGKISKIIKVIDDIAFQTNILALNAAVEAARAGDAGMGFAVVADEVRNLAQRCAQAARDTTVLIQESIEKSDAGSREVNSVAAGIRAITTSAAQAKSMVEQVSAGSQEQARGIEQIAKAITQMEHVTQSAAASAEESASTAEELTAHSESLHKVAETLSKMLLGANALAGRLS